jgi:integrase
MAGTAGKLTERDAREATAGGAGYRLLADGRRLYLYVSPTGRKCWMYKYMFLGRSHNLTIGPYPEISLEAARARHAQLRALAASGVNPAELKREGRLPPLRGPGQASQGPAPEGPAPEGPGPEGPGPTFRDIAEGFLDSRRGRFSDSCLEGDEGRLARHLYPALGGMRAADVRREDLAGALAPLAAAGRGKLCAGLACLASRIFRRAMNSGLESLSDPAGGLAASYPHAPGAGFAAITEPGAFGRLLADIDAFQGSRASDSLKAALRLAPYVFTRPAELTGAEWDETDLEGGTWTVRKERTPNGRPHVVPLSRQALSVLRGRRERAGGWRHVFPAPTDPRMPLPKRSLTFALRAMGYAAGEMTSFGFRVAARALLAGSGERPDAIELQLARRPGKAFLAAIDPDALMDERRAMMQRWADRIDLLRSEAEAARKCQPGGRKGLRPGLLSSCPPGLLSSGPPGHLALNRLLHAGVHETVILAGISV